MPPAADISHRTLTWDEICGGVASHLHVEWRAAARNHADDLTNGGWTRSIQRGNSFTKVHPPMPPHSHTWLFLSKHRRGGRTVMWMRDNGFSFVSARMVGMEFTEWDKSKFPGNSFRPHKRSTMKMGFVLPPLIYRTSFGINALKNQNGIYIEIVMYEFLAIGGPWNTASVRDAGEMKPTLPLASHSLRVRHCQCRRVTHNHCTIALVQVKLGKFVRNAPRIQLR